VGGRERDREGETRRLALLAFLLGHVADADARFVVHDGACALAVGDGRVGRAAQVDEEALVRLGEPVAVDEHGDGPGRLAGGDRQRARGGLVVAAGRGGAAGGGVGDRDRLAGGSGQGHGEGGRPRTGVALGDRHVAYGDRRRGRRRRRSPV